MPPLSVSEHDDGVLIVDSRLIAGRLGLDHNDWFNNIVIEYQTETEQAFGIVRFENVKTGKRGRPPRFALLTEDQSTFLMTLSRNSPEVVQCKIELIQAFSKAKELLRQREPRPGYVPYWYERMKIALSDAERPLQRGYFCVYQEIMGFFAELETRLDYLVSDIDPATGKHLVPDISIGSRFNQFLRSGEETAVYARQHFLGTSDLIDFRPVRHTKKEGWLPAGKDHSQIRYYNHVYPKISHGNYQVQQANSYPDKYLMLFKYYLQEWWVPEVCFPYLPWKRFLELVGGIESQAIEMVPSREKNYLVGDRRVGAVTFHGRG